MNDQNKNLILATALSFVVILCWFLIFPPEEPPIEPTLPDVPIPSDPAVPDLGVATLPPVVGSSADDPAHELDAQAEAVSVATRIPIETPSITGSVSVVGGRLDDLSLVNYKETLDEDSENVRLFSPAGRNAAYYSLFGWAPGPSLNNNEVPGPGTPWSIEVGSTLSPDNPVTLVWSNGSGLTFRRTIAVDERYMFYVTQSVSNNGNETVRMAPYGLIARHGEPDVQGFFILHEGVVRMSDGELQEIDYSDVPDLTYDPRERGNIETLDVGQGGWVGFTDKYWMATLIPIPGQSFKSVAKYTEASDIYQTEARMPTVEVHPGGSASVETMLFAGAKEWDAIRGYEQSFGIDRFIDSIDWGWFFFLTKPIFMLLRWINNLIGNMGWAIIGLTLVIKAFLFPLAYKSYVSLAKMKELQPELAKLKEKVGDDKKRLQQEMMAYYKTHKINPASGCLPILPQIPIFFSLYKVIFVTIEMRHAPFIWWLKDLSAPDPTSILNLFGALPWSPPDPASLLSLISLGVLPILLGVTMWLQQKLNPAPTDPTQAAIFAWLPWIFMFMLGRFASGLIIYWIANNTITFVQQYAIMRTQGVRPDVLGNIRDGIRKRTAAPSAEGKSTEQKEPDKPTTQNKSAEQKTRNNAKMPKAKPQNPKKQKPKPLSSKSRPPSVRKKPKQKK